MHAQQCIHQALWDIYSRKGEFAYRRSSAKGCEGRYAQYLAETEASSLVQVLWSLGEAGKQIQA